MAEVAISMPVTFISQEFLPGTLQGIQIQYWDNRQETHCN